MKLLICYGTRPEYIKVKSLIQHFKNVETLFTGQHENLIEPSNKITHKLDIHNYTDNRLNNIIMSILKHSYIFNDITHVLVQGDTTSAMGIALSAFHHQKQVIHLEAGLRTFDIFDPYPEELNRQMISRIASIHLCPTELNKQNLINENIRNNIYIVGNTGLDNISKNNICYNNKVLITLHRRDNHHNIDKWFMVLSQIAKKYTDIEFIFPIHPNPSIIGYANLLENINVIKPINHSDLIVLLKECKFVISDSGGLQEEASFLNKKIIICRQSTERPEILGTYGILCPIPESLSDIVDDVYNDYKIDAKCPYGEGDSWEKIGKILNLT